jgi:hypothetical protein
VLQVFVVFGHVMHIEPHYIDHEDN